MANNLSTAQRSAFSGGKYDLASFPRRLELDDNDGTVVEITSRVNKFGTTRSSVYGLNPADRGPWSFPGCSFEVLNSDGYFSPGAAGSVFGSADPATFSVRLWIADLVTDPTGSTLLVDQRFDLVEVSLVPPRAYLVGIIPLGRHWGRIWNKEDRDEVDYNGWPQGISL